MKNYLYTLFVITLVNYSILAGPGSALCTTYTAQADCTSSGYCQWSSSACAAYTSTADCYRIDEIGSCRSGGIYYSGTPTCVALTALNVQYNNVCGISSTIDYNYVRFPIVTTGYPDYSLTGLTISQLQGQATKSDYLYQVFTVNLQTATNTQLNAILDLYIAYGTELVASTTHPYYLEKAMFNTIQNLRDDNTGLTTTAQDTTMTKFWTLALIYLKRLQTYSKHYQTNYYMINFAQTTFSRLYLTVNGQDHTTTLSWTTYTSNGYVQVISYPAKQFGIASSISDVVYVRIIMDDAAQTLYTTLAPTITYINSGSATIATSQTFNLFSSILTSTSQYASATKTTSSVTCDSTAKKCTYALTSGSSEYMFYFS